MQYALTRKDYEQLCRDDRDREERYPKSTGRAIEELRLRGLDADRLEYILQKADIDLGFKPGCNRRWSKKTIDQAAEALDRARAYTKKTAACAAHHIQYAQYLQAVKDAMLKGRHVDTDMQVITIWPYGYGFKKGPGSLPGYELAPYNLLLFHVDEKYLKRLAKAFREHDDPQGDAVVKSLVELKTQREIERAILNTGERRAAKAKKVTRTKVSGQTESPAGKTANGTKGRRKTTK